MYGDIKISKNKRKSILKSVTRRGISLHNGNETTLQLIPAIAGFGIKFVRTDVDTNGVIEANSNNVSGTCRGTKITNDSGVSVSVIEHLMAALYILGITDIEIRVDREELPIFDGSAKMFIEMIEEAGIAELHLDADYIVIDRPLFVNNDKGLILAVPYNEFRVSCYIAFDNSSIKEQVLDIVIDDEIIAELANAKTFCLENEINTLRSASLALGGSLKNAIVYSENGVLNPENQSYSDEAVRHKVLDLVGDMKLCNANLQGHLIAIKPGHELNINMAKMLDKLRGII